MKGPKYVKEFDFNVKPCNYSHGGDVKMASGGYYNKGGSCDTPKMASGGYYKKGGSVKKYALGGDAKADISRAIDRGVASGDRNLAQKLGDLRTMDLGRNSTLTIGGGLKSPSLTYVKRFSKGGDAKASKVGKVMGEYKEGKLHSGSKKGPEVTSRKQAVAIALSEGRKAAKKG